MMRVYIRCQKYIQDAGSVITRTAARPYRSFNLYALSYKLHQSSTYDIIKTLPKVHRSIQRFFICSTTAAKGAAMPVVLLLWRKWTGQP